VSDEAAVRVLSGEDILGAKDAEVRRVPVPEWGGVVCIRALDAAARDLLESWQYAKREAGDESFAGFRVRLACLALCDGVGQPIFQITDEASFADAAAGLARKSGVVVNRIADAAMDLNGIGGAAEDAAEGN